MKFKLVLGQVPEPEHMPIGRAYRHDMAIGIVDPSTSTPHLIRSIPKEIQLPEWEQWISAFNDPTVDPYLSWVDPENHLPERYWRMPISPESIPLAVRM